MLTTSLHERFNPDGSDLRNLQLDMLEMLKYIDSICQKHKIKYWLSSGTLLGAVRHAGFIPWDDDLDIEMLRDDYLKLLSILSNETIKQEGYILQTFENDINYVLPYAKLRKLDSIVNEKGEEDKNYIYRGIFIDIFPLERGSYIISRIMASLHNKLLTRPARMQMKFFGLKNAYLRIAKLFSFKLLYPIVRLIIKPMVSSEKVFHTFGVPFYKEREMKDLFPLKKITFEGKEFNSPASVDNYLKKIYGDYMKLPSEQDIVFHFKK